eukprot:TRINITY_DN36368_c0_g1_i1.p1 TRINITY_DN36368_c0_g1~~TRINITY_DN36368_c0_g1_i1.p1  ORF type:complete len:125 (+),score=21.82 TRINITY_DN36368_c0_g1_i1:310-684(+)
MKSVVLVLVVALTLLCVEAKINYSAFVADQITQHPVVIFSKSYCPYCRRAKQVFSDLQVTPFVIELDERDDGAKIQDAVSKLVHKRTVPQVFINGKHLGGSDDTVEAYENGSLAELLEEGAKEL